jgi:hypothetical protein
LAALPGQQVSIDQPPLGLQGPSAATAWLGTQVASLRQSLQTAWHARVAEPWAERHQAVKAQRQRLVELEALSTPTTDERIEALRLRGQLQPDLDQLPALVAFNADHSDHVLGLYLEACQRLKHGDNSGLALLERLMALDPHTTKPACEQAHAFLTERDDTEQAKLYADRWTRHDTWENNRAAQLSNLNVDHALLPPQEMGDAALANALAIVRRERAGVKRAYLARRVIPADPDQATYVLALEVTRWTRWRKQQGQVVNRLAAHEWPEHVLICTLEGQYKPIKRQLQALPGAEIALT